MERFAYISRGKELHSSDFLHSAVPHHPSSNFQSILCALHLEHIIVHKFSLAIVNGVNVLVTVVSALMAGVYVENITRTLSGRSPVWLWSWVIVGMPQRQHRAQWAGTREQEPHSVGASCHSLSRRATSSCLEMPTCKIGKIKTSHSSAYITR